MLKKLALIAIAAGSMAAALPMAQADARPGVFAGRGHSFQSFSARPAHFRHHHFRSRFIVPVYSYAYYDSYGDGCYWMKRRAIHTGSAYWWHRYRDCRGY